MLIKAGTYRFNDVLTNGTTNDFTIQADVNFTTVFTVEEVGEIICNCTKIRQDSVGYLEYCVASSVPDMSGMGITYPTFFYVWTGDEWGRGMYSTSCQTIVISENTEVSSEFYEWFTANAKPVVASIHYNGSAIASLVGGDTATLKCKGMKMEDDVVVAVGELPETEIPEPKLQEKTATENGEYFPGEGYVGFSKVTVAVEGSGVPNFPNGDGNTHIWITLREDRASPMLGIGLNGTATVDWGDGTVPDVLTGTSTSAVVWTPIHEYGHSGDYVITITVDGEMSFIGNGSHGSYILRHDTGSGDINRTYFLAVSKVEIGDGVTCLGEFAFYRCDALSAVRIPDGVKNAYRYACYNCYSLTRLDFPGSLMTIYNAAFIMPGARYFDFTRHKSVPTLLNVNAFEGIPNDCEIRVPAALYDEWIAATNWSTYASNIVAV